MRKAIRRLGARRGAGHGGTVGKTGQHVEKAFGGRRYIVSRLGRLMARLNDEGMSIIWRDLHKPTVHSRSSPQHQPKTRNESREGSLCANIAIGGSRYVVLRQGRVMMTLNEISKYIFVLRVLKHLTNLFILSFGSSQPRAMPSKARKRPKHREGG